MIHIIQLFPKKKPPGRPSGLHVQLARVLLLQTALTSWWWNGFAASATL